MGRLGIFEELEYLLPFKIDIVDDIFDRFDPLLGFFEGVQVAHGPIFFVLEVLGESSCSTLVELGFFQLFFLLVEVILIDTGDQELILCYGEFLGLVRWGVLTLGVFLFDSYVRLLDHFLPIH